MTPLMAACAAAFCFFSSSIVFLNSFSSESLNKKKMVINQKPPMVSNCSKGATFQSTRWLLIENLWNMYVQGDENELWCTWGSTPSNSLVIMRQKMYMLCNTEKCIFKYTVQKSHIACLVMISLRISLERAHVWMHWEEIYYENMEY